MKISKIAMFVSIMAMLVSNVLSAYEVANQKHNVNVGRVVQLVKLVNNSNIQVNIVVVDLGGSTDVSPSQKLYFNLYVKGEMFSTDASFLIGQIYSFKSAKRISAGVYEVIASVPSEESGMPEQRILTVDAREAITSIQRIDCGYDFDCDASTNFTSSVYITAK